MLAAWTCTPALYTGLMFLCCLPSTMRASIVFAAIAGGTVAAALCSVSFEADGGATSRRTPASLGSSSRGWSEIG